MTQPFTTVAIGETIFMGTSLRLSVDSGLVFLLLVLLTKFGLSGVASLTSGIAFSFLPKIKQMSFHENNPWNYSWLAEGVERGV
jgi:hypothetical protein